MTDSETVGYRPICPDCGATGKVMAEHEAEQLAEMHRDGRDCEATTVEGVTEADEATRAEAVGHA